ncbi:MAG TPA: DUF4124 domain-containing protein [Candidatus Binatia bacterium]|nr:DUF4124 domain-containing protein [Candidatus Binatia bacterium]
MRRIGTMVLVAGLMALPARADEVYSWVDRGGTRHYSNVPTETAAPTGLDIPTSAFTTAGNEDEPLGADVIQDVAAEADAPEAVEETIQRNSNEKALRQIDQRLGTIDRQLADLAQARTAHAGGTPETGGLGTHAGGYLSPEEVSLGAEREELTKQASRLRSTDAGLQ